MLHHCFAGPLACFRYIFWNIEKVADSLPPPPRPWTQEIKWVIEWVIDICIVLSSQCGTLSKQMQKGVVKTILAKYLISVK